MLTKNTILKQLEQFSIARGKPVIVHSSLKAIGEIDGGAETLLSSLIDYFTEQDGLLCIPTHTWNQGQLDLKNPSTCIGVLPNIAALHPHGKRSLHPSHSMMVFGKEEKIDAFIKNEAFVDTPTSPDGCYGNLYKEDGYILLIGVDQRKNTFIHCVEEMLNVNGRLTENKVEQKIIYEDGKIEKRFIYKIDTSCLGDISKRFIKFETPLRYYDCIIDGNIGEAPTQLCSAKKMKDVLEIIYKNANGQELLEDDKPIPEEFYRK